MKLGLLARTLCFLLDLDGTFYLGDRLLPGALEFIDLLQERGLDFLFITNNSSHHRRHYAEKIRSFGLVISDDRIFTSSEATAQYIAKQQPEARLHVVGTPALEETFEGFGFQLTNENPDFVVLGFDTTLTYEKLWRLCDLVREGIPYIATHHDLNCPTEGGYMPDIGAMIAFVEASTGRRPDVIVGKPHRPMLESIELKVGISAKKLCMVGDRLYTDVALGKHGLTTVMVLSGEARQEDLRGSEFLPDFVLENLGELAALLRSIPRVL
ncbi:MAG: HAD family hydrolase [Chloroflexi bacterium RBG_16_48_8]|nr:MAG: HAD family hydrolase [Chloroflexi bacterium RBG_16_48_8]